MRRRLCCRRFAAWCFGGLESAGLRPQLGAAAASRLVACVFLFLAFATANAAPLDDQIAAFKKAPATQNEAAVTQLLKTGIGEHRSAEALATAQPWLNRNYPQTQQALFYAGQAAEYAGEWLAAVGYYQRLLQVPKVAPKAAGVATEATYRLLLNSIGDENAAYLFMRKEGNRLRAFGRAKKFDQWFLDQAQSRSDLTAIANRLAVVYSSNDALEPYAESLETLLRQLETFQHDGEALFEALDRLAAAKKTTPQIKARIAWVKQIVPLAAAMGEQVNARQQIPEESMDAALKAAATLVAALPYEGSVAVAKGWMHFNAGDSGVFSNFVNPRRAEKAAPILKALRGLPADQAREILSLHVAGARNRKLAEYLFSREDVRVLVTEIPEVFNTLSAPDVPLFDKTLTPEDAKTMVPHLVRNPHSQAAMVRAWAKPERKYSAVTDDMMKSEMWRFNDVKALTHGLWHSGLFERDVEHDVPIKKYANLDARYQQLKKQVSKEAKPGDRKAAINTIYKDLLSANPSIPGALPLWDELFTNAADADLVQMFKAMVADTTGDRGLLLRRALSKARFGEKKNGSMFWEGQVYDNQFRYHRKPVQDAVPDLIAHLQGMIAKQTKAGTVDPMVFGMWLHTVDPKQDDAVALIQTLIASPAYLKLDPSYQASVADNNHFGMTAATPAITQAQPQYISRELLALPKDAAPQAVEAAFNAVVKRAAAASEPIAIVGLGPVAALPNWSDQTRGQVLSLFRENAPTGAYPTRQGYEQLIQRICTDLAEKKQWGEIEPYLPGLWHSVAWTDDHNHYRGAAALAQFAEAALKADQTSIALSAARNGSKSRAARDMKASINPMKTELLGRVIQVQGKASIAIGIIDIPVDETDPAYPIYKSQSEFALGNVVSAWDLYDQNADQLQPVIRQLTA